MVSTILLDTTGGLYWDGVTAQTWHRDATRGEGSARGQEGQLVPSFNWNIYELKINDTKYTAWPISGQAPESPAPREWRCSHDGCAETSDSLTNALDNLILRSRDQG